jgi:hypothetical protein
MVRGNFPPVRKILNSHPVTSFPFRCPKTWIVGPLSRLPRRLRSHMAGERQPPTRIIRHQRRHAVMHALRTDLPLPAQGDSGNGKGV